MSFQTNVESNIEARAIYDKLDAAAVGDFVAYEELTTLIGRDVQAAGRPSLYKAVRRQRRERQRLWETVRDEGIRLLPDDAVATGVMESGRASLRRHANRQLEKIACIQNFDGLNREQKTNALTAQSMFAVVRQFTSPQAAKHIAAKLGESTTALPIGKTLEIFK